jgi:hypothetical protein
MDNSARSADISIKKIVDFVDRNAVVYLFILFGINVFIKILYAGSMHYWLDETSSIFRAQHSLIWMIRQSFTDPNPPLYFFMLKGWMSLFGISEFSTRLLSVIFSASTVFILYYISRQFFNRETAFYVSLIFTLAQIQLYFSHETRGYTIIVFMSALSFYFYLLTINKPGILNLLMYILTNTFLLYIHPVPVILIIIQFICLSLYFKSSRKGSLYIIVGQVITAILFGAWVLKNSWVSKMQSWIPSPGPGQLKELIITYLNTKFIYYTAFGLLLIFIVILIVRWINKKSVYEDIRSFLILLLWGIFPILIIFLISQYSSRWDTRYMLFATPGLYLLISFLISKLPVNGLIRLALIIAILISSLINLKLNPIKGEDWPDAISFMKQHKDDSTMTIVCADYQFMSFSYYYDKDIFKQLDQAPKILKKDNIYFTKNAGILNQVDTTRFNKIVLILSHEVAADPDGTLLRALSDRYPVTFMAPYMMNVKAYLFDRSLLPVDTLLFDFETDSQFNIAGELSTRAYSGLHVSRTNKDAIYSKGLTCSTSEISGLYSHYFTISIKSLSDSLNSRAELVCSFENRDKIYYWNSIKIRFSDPPGLWTQTDWSLNILHTPSSDDIFKIYAHNLDDDEILFDDLRIIFYK